MPNPEGPEIPYDVILQSEMAAEAAERAEWNFSLPALADVEKRIEDPIRAESVGHHLDALYERNKNAKWLFPPDAKDTAADEFRLENNVDVLAARLHENPYQPWLLELRQAGSLPDYYRWLHQERDRERFTLSNIRQRRPDQMDAYRKLPKYFFLSLREALLGRRGPSPLEVIRKEMIDEIGQATYQEASEHFDRLRGIELAYHGANQILSADGYVQDTKARGELESLQSEWEEKYQAADAYLQSPESWSHTDATEREKMLTQREQMKIRLDLVTRSQAAS